MKSCKTNITISLKKQKKETQRLAKKREAAEEKKLAEEEKKLIMASLEIQKNNPGLSSNVPLQMWKEIQKNKIAFN